VRETLLPLQVFQVLSQRRAVGLPDTELELGLGVFK